MKKAKMEVIQPTPERLAKGDIIDWEDSEDAGRKYARVRTQTILDRYREQQVITKRQYDAGYKLYQLWYAAGQQKSVIGGYGVRVGASDQMTDHQAYSFSEYCKALRSVGLEMSLILTSVCLVNEPARTFAKQRGEQDRSGVVMLRWALDALGDYFGWPRDA